MPKTAKAGLNEDLILAFTELAQLEMAEGSNGFVTAAYQKVAKALKGYTKKVTSGKQVAGLPGVGKASVTKIQQFLDDGEIPRLEELRETHGDVAGKLPTKKNLKGKKLTKKQQKEISSLESDLNGDRSYTVATLKSELRSNDQKVTGTRAELAARVAEGRTLGKIPRCEICGLGRPVFNTDTGLYSCKGGFDDTDWRPCSFLGMLERTQWTKEESSEEEESEEDSSSEE